jgi:hypothetical protein
MIVRETGHARPCHAKGVRVEPGIGDPVHRREIDLLADCLHGIRFGERRGTVQQAGVNPANKPANQAGIVDGIEASPNGIERYLKAEQARSRFAC